MATTKKEIAKSIKTLIVLLKPLRGSEVTITLRNDTLVKGTIENVDADMNIELSNATLADDPFYCTKPQVELKESSRLEDSRSEEEEVEVLKGSSDNNEDLAFADGADEATTDSDDDSTVTTAAKIATSTTNNKEDPSPLDYFMVKGSRIRHIDLPADCDLLEGARCEIERIRNRGKQWTKRDIVVRTEAERSF